ncbi:MAG: hypothetical protein Q9201_002490 [Fulgogasparrea decipioides]
MSHASSRGLFQKPTKSKKLTFKDPSSGREIQLPSLVERTPSTVPSASLPTVVTAQALAKPSLKPLTSFGTESTRLAEELKVEVKEVHPKARDKKGEKTTVKRRPLDVTSKDPLKKSSAKASKEKSATNGARSLEGVKASQELPKHRSQQKPDVYAHAYVPEAFLAVNATPAILLTSTPAQAIDFVRYTATFATLLFLPPLSTLQAPAFHGAAPVGSLDDLGIESYEQHLSDCLVLDLEAQVPEIRTYDMFGVGLSVIDRGQEMYGLHVPGLRENTPRVAFGDNVMVRQLVMDPATRLPLAAPASGSTGYQISAVVVGVDRPKEILNLRINGFTPHLLMCNIMFIVQTRWIKSLQRAVNSLAIELKASQVHGSATVSQEQVSEDTASTPEHDFGPIGTPIKSPPIKSRNGYFGLDISSPKSPTTSRKDYFGAVGTPGKTPRIERQDYFAFMSRNSQGDNDSRPTEMDEPESRFRSSFDRKTRDIPVQYTNQGWLRRALFPEDTDGVMQRSLPQGVFKRSWFDRHLNHEQKKAVDGVLTKYYGSVPFLINGPPGTGKTKTMVETVMQMTFDADNEGAILLCAPSDSAADTLTLRLRKHLDPKVMFRLNDFSRTFAEVPEEILPYCYIEDDIFNIPPLPELMACKIVIATCRATDVLVQARVTNRDLVKLENSTTDILNPQLAAKRQAKRISHLHWTALLVDEAAQATEPEMLIPLSVVAPPASCSSEPNPIFVMAGDQYQLGPRVYDKSTTLRVSLFERLSNRSMYASHPLARQSYRRLGPPIQMLRPAFVNLTRNYRSHPAILAIPSALFYADTLIPEATDTDQLEPWHKWQGRRWPVLFVCNGGIDNCEDIKTVGGGWYNIREARKAIALAKDLLESGHIEQQGEICIMSPFRAQVNVLRNMARKIQFWDLNIGPMDAFQGLESRFVIICTTRTRSRFLEEDAIKAAGIVNEPKKFNVAVTRAKQGLVVLGNPWVLEQDPHWCTFMRFCWRNGLWQTDPDGRDDRMAEAQEKAVNEWSPGTQADIGIAGLEKALLYKEREPVEGGSKAVRRFMSERGEDEIWTLGRLAEAALRESDS